MLGSALSFIGIEQCLVLGLFFLHFGCSLAVALLLSLLPRRICLFAFASTSLLVGEEKINSHKLR